MFKKITAIILISAFTNAYAVTPVQQSFSLANELNKTFDELNYKLNVEWDQTDSSFMNGALNDFEKEITTLQNQGLSSNDLVQYTMDKVKDKETQDEINAMAEVIDANQMNAEEARAFALSKINSTYAHGASWYGSRVRVHVALLVGVIIILICATQIHGKKGSDGTNGTNGTNGTDGKDGKDKKPSNEGKNNGYGNGDQNAPGNSCTHNNAENKDCA